MLTDDELGEALRHALHDGTWTPSPRPDLADRVISQVRRERRRKRIGCAGLGTGIIAAAALVVALVSSHSPRPVELRFASYAFRLPSGSRVAASTPAACAFPVGFVYTPAPGESASDATQPAVANAVTSAGGCVTMLLSNPYTPGADNAPQTAMSAALDQHAVTIASDPGTIGTYVLDGSDMSSDGVPIPSGTEKIVLTLHLPADDGQTQDLQVSAAGISEQQLISIVSSGLTASAPSGTTP